MTIYKITINTIDCEGRIDGEKVVGYFATKELGNKAIEEVKANKFFYNLYKTDKEGNLVTRWEEIEVVTK